MAKTLSTMLELGTKAPFFKLPDTNGNEVSNLDFNNSKALLVVFMCNHCPYVKHVSHELAKICDDYKSRGLAMVGINSNDVNNHEEDSPAKMKEELINKAYHFPYLYDETQEVAKAYKAACTPDFFLFNQEQLLVYRGQLDDSRPSSDVPVTGKDLRTAIEQVLNNKTLTEAQKPSMGCNIKWKPGNEPNY